MNKHYKIFRFDGIVVEQAIYAPNLYMPPHTDKVSRISIILDGIVKETAGTEDVSATTGSLIIKPRHAVHENTFGNAPVRILTIGFEDDALFARHFTNWQYINHPKIYVQAIRLCTELIRTKNDKALTAPLASFSSIALLKYDVTGKTFFWVEQLKELLAQNLSDPENISVLSDKLSLHRVYMTRTFKKRYGVSPVEYRKYKKIAAAFLDLALTDKSLAAIAYDTGFSDQSHMTREFATHAGCTPGELRQIMTGS